MKKAIHPAFYVLLLLAFSSCDKAYGPTDTAATTTLQVSQTGPIQKGNPVNISLNAVPSGSAVKWTSKPDTGVTISANGNSAAFVFKSAGTYLISGTFGTVTASSTLTVGDTTITTATGNSSYKDVGFAAGEQINIVATKMGDSTKSGFILSGTTIKKYACSSWRKTTVATSGNSLTINFDGVLEPVTPLCATPEVAAVGGGTLPSVAPGTTVQLIVHFNGTQYTGSITKSATSNAFMITWPYTTGVVISPLNF